MLCRVCRLLCCPSGIMKTIHTAQLDWQGDMNVVLPSLSLVLILVFQRMTLKNYLTLRSHISTDVIRHLYELFPGRVAGGWRLLQLTLAKMWGTVTSHRQTLTSNACLWTVGGSWSTQRRPMRHRENIQSLHRKQVQTQSWVAVRWPYCPPQYKKISKDPSH